MGRKIDHIVYCVPDLSQAVDDMESKLGVRPSGGGRHMSNGTKNALLNIGYGCYLELLAKDEENHNFKGDRWMGVDLVNEAKVTRWSLKSDHLASDCEALNTYVPGLGKIFEGSRKTIDNETLKWKMSLPLAFPDIELIPFMTDWSQSEYHPTDKLPQMCELTEFQLFHPAPDSFSDLFEELGLKVQLTKSKIIRIQIKIKSPTGIHVMS